MYDVYRPNKDDLSDLYPFLINFNLLNPQIHPEAPDLTSNNATIMRSTFFDNLFQVSAHAPLSSSHISCAFHIRTQG